MIELTRPLMPDWDFVTLLLRSKKDQNMWSNFGSLHRACEERLERHTGRYCVPVVNGTVAIRLALQCAFPVGTRVAIPDYTHIGTLQAVTAAHMRPVIMGCSGASWQIDPMLLQRHKEKYDAFVVVSPFGYRVDTRFYDQLAEKLGKKVVYDFAGAWGQFPRTKHPVAYSFHATKNFSCGEGGMVAFTSNEQYVMAKRMINFGIMPDRLAHTPLADNMKVDEMRAAMILAHLCYHDGIEKRMDLKRETLQHYIKELGPLGYLAPNNAIQGNPSLCVLSGFDDVALLERTALGHGIVVKKYFPLLSSMPASQMITKVGVSSQILNSCVALPSDVTSEERDYVVNFVKSWDGNKNV